MYDLKFSSPEKPDINDEDADSNIKGKMHEGAAAASSRPTTEKCEGKVEAAQKLLPADSPLHDVMLTSTRTSEPSSSASSSCIQVAQEPTSSSSTSSTGVQATQGPASSASSTSYNMPPRPTREPPAAPEDDRVEETTWWAAGCTVIHANNEIMIDKVEKIVDIANMLTEVLGGYHDGQPGQAQEHDKTGAIVMMVYDVGICWSTRTGNKDITLGIAGPDSPNKSTNSRVRSWRNRIYMRGVTDDGRKHFMMRQVVRSIVMKYGWTS